LGSLGEIVAVEMPLARGYGAVVAALVSVEAVDLSKTYLLAVFWRCMLEVLH
jgi:hypothetical protein